MSDVLLIECPDCAATFPARDGFQIWVAAEAHNRVCQARTAPPTTERRKRPCPHR